MEVDNSYRGVLNPDTERLVRAKARQLVGRYGFTAEDIPDLEQELASKVVQALPRYDPKKGKRSTYLQRVVDRKVASLIEAKKAAKRDYRVPVVSLDEEGEGEEGETWMRHEVVGDQTTLGSAQRETDLRVDLDRVLRQLPPRLGEVCELLKTKSLTQVSRETGIPRGTLYEYLDRLRSVFEDEGLRGYLEDG